MVKRTLKVLQQMLQDFYGVFDHFGKLWITFPKDFSVNF